jgi:hypothetical protein
MKAKYFNQTQTKKFTETVLLSLSPFEACLKRDSGESWTAINFAEKMKDKNIMNISEDPLS